MNGAPYQDGIRRPFLATATVCRHRFLYFAPRTAAAF